MQRLVKPTQRHKASSQLAADPPCAAAPIARSSSVGARQAQRRQGRQGALVVAGHPDCHDSMSQTTINGGKALVRLAQGRLPSVGALSMRYSTHGRITVNWHCIRGSVAGRGGLPPRNILCGHGRPIPRSVAAILPQRCVLVARRSQPLEQRKRSECCGLLAECQSMQMSWMVPSLSNARHSVRPKHWAPRGFLSLSHADFRWVFAGFLMGSCGFLSLLITWASESMKSLLWLFKSAFLPCHSAAADKRSELSLPETDCMTNLSSFGSYFFAFGRLGRKSHGPPPGWKQA